MSSTSMSPPAAAADSATGSSAKSDLLTDACTGYRYQIKEFVEFAQLFISDGKTILIEDDPPTRGDHAGRWVQGWFRVTPTMVDHYREAAGS